MITEIKRLKASKTWGEEDLAGEAARETRMNALRASDISLILNDLRSDVTPRSRAAAKQQLMIDWLDIWIPAAGARLVDVNEGTLGIIGCDMLKILAGPGLTGLQFHHLTPWREDAMGCCRWQEIG